MPVSIRKALVLCAFTILSVAPQATAASDATCKRPELVWEVWRDHVLASNAGAQMRELRGSEREKILLAFDCDRASDQCPPDKVITFYCRGNAKVLLAFVKQGCVTLAEDVPVEEYRRLIDETTAC